MSELVSHCPAPHTHLRLQGHGGREEKNEELEVGRERGVSNRTTVENRQEARREQSGEAWGSGQRSLVVGVANIYTYCMHMTCMKFSRKI